MTKPHEPHPLHSDAMGAESPRARARREAQEREAAGGAQADPAQQDQDSTSERPQRPGEGS